MVVDRSESREQAWEAGQQRLCAQSSEFKNGLVTQILQLGGVCISFARISGRGDKQGESTMTENLGKIQAVFS